MAEKKRVRFDSTTPRKCSIVHTPHDTLMNAASGDRKLPMSKPQERMQATAYKENLPDLGENRGTSEIKDIGDGHDHHNEGNAEPWVQKHQDIVSETTEWVYYND